VAGNGLKNAFGRKHAEQFMAQFAYQCFPFPGITTNIGTLEKDCDNMTKLQGLTALCRFFPSGILAG